MNRIFRYEMTKLYPNKTKIVLSIVFIIILIVLISIGFYKLPKHEASMQSRESILNSYEQKIDQLNVEIQQCKESGNFDLIKSLESIKGYYNYFLLNGEIEDDYYLNENGPFVNSIRFFRHSNYTFSSAMLYILIPSFFIIFCLMIYLINKVFLMDVGDEIKNIMVDNVSFRSLFKNKCFFIMIWIISCWLFFTIFGVILGLFDKDVNVLFYINNTIIKKNVIEIFLSIQIGMLIICYFIASIMLFIGSFIRKQAYTNLYSIFIIACIFIISKVFSSIFLKDVTQGSFNDVVYYLPISSIIQSIYGFNRNYFITIIVHILVANTFVYLSYKQYIRIEA